MEGPETRQKTSQRRNGEEKYPSVGRYAARPQLMQNRREFLGYKTLAHRPAV